MLSLFAEQTTTYLVWSRLQLLHEWWHWPTLILGVLLTFLFTAWLYRRDTVELTRTTAITLLSLRWLALATLVLFFFGLERRSEQRSIQNSRLAILVDTSQSMGMNDDSQAEPGTRMDRIRQLFSESQWLTSLRTAHDVLVYATSDSDIPEQIGMFPQTTSTDGKVATENHIANRATEEGTAWWGQLAVPSVLLGGAAFVIFLAMWFVGREVSASRFLAASVGLLSVGGAILAWHDLQKPSSLATHSPPATPETLTETPSGVTPDWKRVLVPQRDATRLGDSLFSVLQQNRSQPLAGIIVLTDGAQNQGRDPLTITQFARQQTVPIHAVGLGTTRLPRNATLLDLQLPPRIYPQDQFHATVYLQGSQIGGRQVEVQLFAKPVPAQSSGGSPEPGSGSSNAAETLIDTQQVTLGQDYELVSTRFNLEPPGAGTWQYRAAIVALPQEVDLTDNERIARVTVVDRKTRVLLVAGGPTREYQFVRNQLFRDASMQSDTWLQTATAGTAQEAQQVLAAFPSTAQELFAYDCMIAFDPDWTQLTQQQIELCERWVSEEAGGMLLIAGPVHTHRWAEAEGDSATLEKMRALYPVEFYRRGRSSANLGRTSSDQPWPLQLTTEGASSRFLWLGDSQEESLAHWASFPGFFSYFAVKGPKPGATVYGNFSDPDTEIRGQFPPFLVGHFYGAGRTLFVASGELWRLRAIDVAYQEQLYTKLVRYISEGRLLRDSARGMLLLDKQRCTRGERITARAQLKDLQLNPWQAAQAEASLAAPDGTRQPLVLPSSPEAPGVFQGTFVAEQPGTYVVSLQIPEGDEYQRLTREVEVRLADRELEHPLRADPLLTELTQETGGSYYVGVPAMLGERGIPAVAQKIRPRQQITIIEGAPDSQFDQRWMKWLLLFLGGSLCVEWLVRRLHRLA